MKERYCKSVRSCGMQISRKELQIISSTIKLSHHKVVISYIQTNNGIFHLSSVDQVDDIRFYKIRLFYFIIKKSGFDSASKRACSYSYEIHEIRLRIILLTNLIDVRNVNAFCLCTNQHHGKKNKRNLVFSE